MNSCAKQIIQDFVEAGPDTLIIAPDLDGTMTVGENGGKPPALSSFLRRCNLLHPDYPKKALALHDHYAPFEASPTLDSEEKKRLMEEWTRAHMRLMIEYGLTKHDLANAVQKSGLQFRKRTHELLDLSHMAGIPVVIVSATTTGESVRLLFQTENSWYPNMDQISNRFIWAGEKAQAIGEPVVHPQNKGDLAIDQFPEIVQRVNNRTNCIVLGDNPGDASIGSIFNPKGTLRIGYYSPLPKHTEKETALRKEAFEKSFDIIIENKRDFLPVLNILQQIVRG